MYFLTSIEATFSPSRPLKSSRCWGYYPTIEEAELVVKNNDGDMIECLYTHLVIEYYRPGVIAMAEEKQWYREENNEWVKCEKPELIKCINFAIG